MKTSSSKVQNVQTKHVRPAHVTVRCRKEAMEKGSLIRMTACAAKEQLQRAYLSRLTPRLSNHQERRGVGRDRHARWYCAFTDTCNHLLGYVKDSQSCTDELSDT